MCDAASLSPHFLYVTVTVWGAQILQGSLAKGSRITQKGSRSSSPPCHRAPLHQPRAGLGCLASRCPAHSTPLPGAVSPGQMLQQLTQQHLSCTVGLSNAALCQAAFKQVKHQRHLQAPVAQGGKEAAAGISGRRKNSNVCVSCYFLYDVCFTCRSCHKQPSRWPCLC